MLLPALMPLPLPPIFQKLTGDNSARDIADSRGDRMPLLSTRTFTARRLLFMLTTGSRVVTPGIKNPATDQLLLDGLLTGAMPDDHARKLKIAVKCGDYTGGRFRLTVYLCGLR